jgi:O-antigen/teichoic acid export membrane protein
MKPIAAGRPGPPCGGAGAGRPLDEFPLPIPVATDCFPLFPLAVVAGVQTGALSGVEAFSTIALANVIGGLISFPALLLGVHQGGRDGALWGLVATQAFIVLINHFLLTRRLRRLGNGLRIRWAGMWSERPVLWSFSLPAALASSMVMPVNWACIALLARQPDGYEQLGFFNAGNQWRQLTLFVPLQLAAGLLPVLSHLHATGDYPRFRRAALNVVATCTGLAAITSMAIVLLAPLLISVFGKAFAPGSAALLPLMVGAVVGTANTILGSSLNARGDSWRVLAGTAVYGAIAIALTATIWGSSAVGLAWAQCVGSLVATAVLSSMLWSTPRDVASPSF